MAELVGGPEDGKRSSKVAPLIARPGGVYQLCNDNTLVWREGAWQCKGCGFYVTPGPFDVLDACPVCRVTRIAA